MQYTVRALRQTEVVSLVFEAANEADARAQAHAQAVKPLSVEARAAGWSLRRNTSGASGFSLLLFSQELLALLEAGLSIVEAVETLAEKESRPQARTIYLSLKKSLGEGKSFSGALEQAGTVFPPLYVGIVRAAEQTSNLPEALTRHIEYEVRLGAIRSKVLSASIYPLILAGVGLLVTLFLMTYVVPRFASVYQGTGRSLPAASALLLAWGAFAGAHAKVLMAGGIAMLVTGGVALRAAYVSGGIARVLGRIPGIGERVRIYVLARLYLTLGMLIDGGLTVSAAMDLVQAMMAPAQRAQLLQAAVAIRNGARLSDAFEQHGLTTPVSVRFLRVGERSGKLGEMFSRSARYYDNEIARWIDWFTRAFEPLLMAGIGLLVGLIVVLLYMPIFDLAGSFR